MSEPKRIGIAVVECNDRYLVGIRGPNVPLPGYAEFPGGKCLPDETPADCAVRECLEETGLLVEPLRLLQRIDFEYAHGPVDLHFYLCHPVDVAGIREQHSGFRWIAKQELKVLKFPEANAKILPLLCE